MSKAKITHHADGVTITFTGDKKLGLEPSMGVIAFPGGRVEVSRCSDGTYWAHLTVDTNSSGACPGVPLESRVTYNYDGSKNGIIDVPDFDKILDIGIRIGVK